LVALGASLTAEGPDGKEREIAAADFFQAPKSESQRETALRPNEILTGVFVPNNGLKNATHEVRHRFGLDWPYVTASVACAVEDGVISKAKVVLGHVAPTPWMAQASGRALEGAPANEAGATKAGQAAGDGAKPLSRNGYKVAMVKAAVKRAVLSAVA
jgi:xanthine dehydrogenase YagS FAD-binding subunit